MELLSPAGNNEHVNLAIKEKVDAVYGGLKKWNARSKAINFSISEYNKAIKRLHYYGIKFYLTLNVLVTDSEIDDIIKFLKNECEVLPDAFIITDIGLFIEIKKEFPKIPIHISTQFGVHSIDDCKFIESIGAKRVILARELTLNEINKIKKNTDIEIENFVWGSQCISFSGLCFFGSLINCGNSNRGQCIIMCRDIYQVKEENGNFLYIPDLNCTSMIDVLKKQDIDCIKLEGRRRNTKELNNTVEDIKNSRFGENQNGYIFGKNISENNLYEKINKRVKPIYNIKDLKNISSSDVFVRYENNIPKEFIQYNDIKQYNFNEVNYVFSEYKKSLDFNKKNISIDLEIKKDRITGGVYVNSNGVGHIFKDDLTQNNNLIEFRVKEFVDDVEYENEEINFYKVKYIRNKTDRYKITKKLYDEMFDYVINDNIKIRPSNYYSINDNFKIRKLTVETDDINCAIELKKIKNIKIIYNIATVNNFRLIDDIINTLGENVIYKLPMFNFDNINLESYYKKLNSLEVMYTRPSQIFETYNLEFKKKYVDYTVYIWNKQALNFYEKYNIDEYTASPELSYKRNRKIFKNKKMQYIIAGKLPLIYTRQCFSHLYGCENCKKNRSQTKEIKNIDKNILFKIICKDDHRCVIADNPILNNFQYFNNCDDINFRYITTDQNMEEITKTINILKEKDYFKKLKDMDCWKNSYVGNILESRC